MKNEKRSPGRPENKIKRFKVGITMEQRHRDMLNEINNTTKVPFSNIMEFALEDYYKKFKKENK